MSWITDDWRLKLLALGLSVLMLGAVAFSQNPSTSKTITKSVSYTVGPNIIIIDPQTTVQVRVTGLSDVIQPITDRNISALVDASRASPGPAVKLNISITTQAPGVTILNPTVPIVVNIDQLATKSLLVEVNTPRPATGWELIPEGTVATCPGSQSLTQCLVSYTGPAGWEVGLKAVATFPGPIDLDNETVFNVPVNLVQANNSPLPDTPTVPLAGLDLPTVDIHVKARTGSTSTTVPLVVGQPTRPQPSGYRVIGITVSPQQVIITGDQSVLSRIQFITLPGVDLSGCISTCPFRVSIVYPANVTQPGNISTATVTYQVVPNPSPSP